MGFGETGRPVTAAPALGSRLAPGQPQAPTPTKSEWLHGVVWAGTGLLKKTPVNKVYMTLTSLKITQKDKAVFSG